MTSRDQQHPPSALPSGSRSPSRLASPARSRDSSPAPALVSPPLLQPKDSRLRPTNDAVASRLLTPSAAPPNENGRSRPRSLNEVASTLSKIETQDNGSTNNATAPLRWPTSPRLKSPPASASPRRNSASSIRQSDLDNIEPEMLPQPSRPLPVSAEASLKTPTVASNGTSGVKNPRGFSGLTSTLETVEEGDHSLSPNGTEKGPIGTEWLKQREAQSVDKGRSPERVSKDGTSDVTVSDADAGKNKDAPKTPVQAQTPAKKAGPPMVAAKVRPTTEGSSQSMIVETETVASIPQSAAAVSNVERNGTAKRDENGSMRANPNNDALKNKKDKKRTIQKRPSATSGQASSKADIFEARVTSAAEDDDSDSDETFIYESNPPDSRPRPPRHHSRTPSTSSIRSVTERKNGSRSLGPLTDSQRGVRAKRSMKFASNSYAADDESGDRDYGTVRAHRSKNGASSTPHHMHGFSKDSHPPVGDEESPFSQASRLRSSATTLRSPRSPSKVHTPKSGSPPPYSKSPSKVDQASSFDYENGLAFSEQDPLIGSLRAPRTRPPRGFNRRHIDYYDGKRDERGCARRCAGCFVVMMIVTLVLMIAGGFLFATTHPLYGVELLEIENILATEESLMADLKCIATNPNIVPISISEMDVNIFAKSTHTNPLQLQRSHGSTLSQYAPDLNALDNVDDGTDPITDPATMLLGRIFHFDSALTFDASPLHRIAHNATGSLRVQKPGNETEDDGSERWERVVQFPFELIVRGVLKYSLPLSSRVVTVSVRKNVHVDPDDDPDDDDHGEPVDGGNDAKAVMTRRFHGRERRAVRDALKREAAVGRKAEARNKRAAPRRSVGA